MDNNLVERFSRELSENIKHIDNSFLNLKSRGEKLLQAIASHDNKNIAQDHEVRQFNYARLKEYAEFEKFLSETATMLPLSNKQVNDTLQLFSDIKQKMVNEEQALLNLEHKYSFSLESKISDLRQKLHLKPITNE